MHQSKVIDLVKQAMIDHEQDHGKLPDKDWFVKYYMHFSSMISNHPTSTKKKQSRSMWSPDNLKWMPK
jgi:hypothetical protein